jgi:hypothetical protein
MDSEGKQQRETNGQRREVVKREPMDSKEAATETNGQRREAVKRDQWTAKGSSKERPMDNEEKQ